MNACTLNNAALTNLCDPSFDRHLAIRCLKQALKAAAKGQTAGDDILITSSSSSTTTPAADSTNDDVERVHSFSECLYDEGMSTFATPVMLRPQHQNMINVNLNETPAGNEDIPRSAHSCPATSNCNLYHEIRTAIYYNLGLIHALPGAAQDDNEATRCLQKALDIKMSVINHEPRAFGQNQPSFCAILHNVGHVNYRNGRFNDASLMYSQARDMLIRGGNSPSAASLNGASTSTLDRLDTHALICLSATLNCLAVSQLHCVNGQKDKKAEDFKALVETFTEAYATNEEILLKDDSSASLRRATATILNNIGRAKFQALDFASALTAYVKTYEMRVTVLGEEHLDTAATLCNIADTHAHLRDFVSAAESYEKFISIAVPILGEGHCDVAVALSSLGQTLQGMNDLDGAVIYLSRALKASELAFGKNHESIAIVCSYLGHVSYELGLFDASVRAYQAGLAVELQLVEMFRDQVPKTIVNIARSFEVQSLWEKALEHYQNALDIFQEQDSPTKQKDVIEVMSLIAYVHEKAGEFSRAEEVLLSTLELKRQCQRGTDSFSVSVTLNVLGLVRFNMRKYVLANESFFEALRIRHSCRCTPLQIASVTNNIAFTYEKVGNISRAVEYYEVTLDLEKESAELDSPQYSPKTTLFLLMKISTLLQTLNELERMSAKRTEALEFFLEHREEILEDGEDAAAIYDAIRRLFQNPQPIEEEIDGFTKGAPAA